MHAMLSLDLDLNLGLTRDTDTASKSELSTGTRGLKVINMNSSVPCKQAHARRVDESLLTDLAEHQMHVKGAHKCCQCAYNSGYQQGSLLQKFISLDIESLGDSHASADGRYKSIHQAFALGYSDGVNSFIHS
ncbi:hypothetical protein [Colwellia sp. 12G3]|uniref:hypothetical protein n=1 Tax=Colwellia sp. 12G3 TaxID=2058299 RepID=UPI000C34C15E|nr:hypothetical protein [Colwellia sp. 12G3]PKI14114.1 hypothetical protein CXF71_16170 [Colwellia sp. 12G3]